MELRCSLCGCKVEITKVHKDYQKMAANPEKPWICATCQDRVRFQARETAKDKKPL